MAKEDDWDEPRKVFLVELNTLTFHDNGVSLIGRVGFHSIKVGDSIGGKKVLKIEAYGKELSETGSGLTCRITLNGMPNFLVSN